MYKIQHHMYVHIMHSFFFHVVQISRTNPKIIFAESNFTYGLQYGLPIQDIVYLLEGFIYQEFTFFGSINLMKKQTTQLYGFTQNTSAIHKLTATSSHSPPHTRNHNNA